MGGAVVTDGGSSVTEGGSPVTEGGATGQKGHFISGTMRDGDGGGAGGRGRGRAGNGAAIQHIEEAPKECNSMSSPNATSISAKNQNKKRSYVQLHLDLGQSDFLLCTCSICGFKFACGDEGDEKVHKEFHKDCSHGIQFKVQKVVQMMEMDLGSGWLIHKLCKVYLYIFHQRIAGCLVAESIKTAYRVLSNSGPPKSVNNTNTNNNGSNSSILQFGGINFQREAVERAPSAINPEASEEDLMGAIFLGNEAVPAICGIRAIWVAPSMRRKQIACQLLDAVR
ncbi:hypothetical protein HYC85_014051 [Camellia sinensis]|uniref:N-acetyltransferase domain-containing protein n=1 Tax=Camellia sinensis TaxID=4442 RepID=A0A7J7H8C3_CAMSI|nr:hypothetical protein HYC85_014051 [Camellia sinensis]